MCVSTKQPQKLAIFTVVSRPRVASTLCSYSYAKIAGWLDCWPLANERLRNSSNPKRGEFELSKFAGKRNEKQTGMKSTNVHDHCHNIRFSCWLQFRPCECGGINFPDLSLVEHLYGCKAELFVQTKGSNTGECNTCTHTHYS